MTPPMIDLKVRHIPITRKTLRDYFFQYNQLYKEQLEAQREEEMRSWARLDHLVPRIRVIHEVDC
jgi:hypothetical protein